MCSSVISVISVDRSSTIANKKKRGEMFSSFVSYDGGEEKRTKDMYVYDDG